MRLIWLLVLTVIVAMISAGNRFFEIALFFAWMFFVWKFYPTLWSGSEKWRMSPAAFFVDRIFSVVIAAIVFGWFVGNAGKNETSKLDKSQPANKDVVQHSPANK